MWRGSSSSTRGGRAPTSGRNVASYIDDPEYLRELAEAHSSDAARKRGSRRYTRVGVPLPPRFSYNNVEEIKRRWALRAQWRGLASSSNAGSSSGAGSASAQLLVTTIGPEDFVGEGEEERVFHLLLARSAHEAEEEQKIRSFDQRLLEQGLAQAASFTEKKVEWERIRAEQDAKFIDLDPEE